MCRVPRTPWVGEGIRGAGNCSVSPRLTEPVHKVFWSSTCRSAGPVTAQDRHWRKVSTEVYKSAAHDHWLSAMENLAECFNIRCMYQFNYCLESSECLLSMNYCMQRWTHQRHHSLCKNEREHLFLKTNNGTLNNTHTDTQTTPSLALH